MARRRAAGGVTEPPAATDSPPDTEADPDSVAHTICLRLLTIRARSRSELAEALRVRNVPDDAGERVLDRLTRVGLVDDQAFAAEFVRVRLAERGLAGRELSRQLRSKGIEDHIIESVLADVDAGTEYLAARQLAQRKLRSMTRLESQVQTRRLAGMLARKGYSPALTFQVVREVVAATDEPGLEEDQVF